MAKVSIIGTGTWGIALGMVLAQNGHEVTAWSALPKEIEALRESYTCKNLPGVEIPRSIVFTADLQEACTDKEMLVLSVPSVFTRGVAKQMNPFVKEGQLIVSVAKGIEEKTLMTMSQQIEEELPMANVAVLSGPSHAEEVSRGIPTTVVAGAKDRQTAEHIQNLFMSSVFRVYTSPDILGIELGGALKNVIALAAGVSDGLGCGDNTKAALMTRGIAEITRLGVAMGGKPETFSGLSGIGDLIVTRKDRQHQSLKIFIKNIRRYLYHPDVLFFLYCIITINKGLLCLLLSFNIGIFAVLNNFLQVFVKTS